MNLDDLIINTFKTEEIIEINEANVPLTPFTAFAIMKSNFFNKIKNKLIDIKDFVIKDMRDLKATGSAFKEKAKATVGQSSEDTVYKLTSEQVQVMKEMMNKYGDEISDDIIKFRRNILAPYQVVKRLIKKHSTVSSEDITGLTKEEFKRALESGKKKIENRKNLSEDSEKIRERLNKYKKYYENLNKAEDSIENGNPISNTIAQHLFKQFDVGDETLGGYSPEELRRSYDAIKSNYKKMIELSSKFDDDFEDEDNEVMSTLKRRRELVSSGAKKNIDLTKEERERFYNKDNFNLALGKYFFRREILNQLKPGENNIFTKTYQSIIDEMKDKVLERRKKAAEDLKNISKNIEFTENEKKVWKKYKNTSEYSGDINDYYQAIEEKDFLSKVEHIPKSEEMNKAIQEIENEIKKFERSLQKKISDEDFKKLKKYRLINNLISIKELQSPEKIFKDTEDLKGKKREFTIDEIESKADDIIGTNYSSKEKLKNDYNELKQMIKDFPNDEELGSISKKIKQIKRKIEKNE